MWWSFFLVFVVLNLFGAAYFPIVDCDETFNYWEPLHYVAYGNGMQTWEYAPEYALRSYAYPVTTLPLLATAHFLTVQVLGLGKPAVFYTARAVFAVAAAAIEATLCMAVCRRYGSFVGRTFSGLLAFSPGVSAASIALLPSSTCMLFAMLSNALWIDGKLGAAVVVAVAAVTFPCWPFAALLFVPFAVHALARSAAPSRLIAVGAASGVACLALCIAVDASFYGRPLVPLLNILRYNAFSSASGDELYGTEPLSFYARGLALNANVSALLAPLLPLALLARAALGPRGAGALSSPRCLADAMAHCSGAFLWLLVIGSRPHKEERFLYVALPQLSLAAALALGAARSALRGPAEVVGTAAAGAALLCAALVGLLRATSVSVAYGGALQLWSDGYGVIANSRGFKDGAGPLVCAGLEWHRFPGSFFLPQGDFGSGLLAPLASAGMSKAPQGARLGFLRAGFGGQLPQPFGAWPHGTSAAPRQPFNDVNREEPRRYVASVDDCDFVVDFEHEGGDGALRAALEGGGYRRVASKPFLDAPNSRPLARALMAALPTLHGFLGLVVGVDHEAVRAAPHVGANALAADLAWGSYTLFAAPRVQLNAQTWAEGGAPSRAAGRGDEL